MRHRIEILYFNAGGGHRAAALALEHALPEYDVLLTNLFDVIDVKKLFKKITGYEHEDLYNKVLASGFTIGLGPQLKVLQALIKTQRKSMVKKLRAHWQDTQPDFVVSVIPNFDRAIGESIDGPFMTVITDMADYPPNFWIEPKLKNQHVVCGTEYAAAQAIVAGLPPERVHRVQGMIIRPEFYEITPEPSEDVIGFVMFGGIGSKDMIPIAKKLANRKLIMICGKNDKLRQKLIALGNPNHQIIGYTRDIPLLMSKCRYFIGKPGPGSLSEAIQMNLPVIVPHNAFTMPQERWNVQWVLDNDVGQIVNDFKHIDIAVGTLLERLHELRANTKGIKNDAVFKIPRLIAGFVNTGQV